MLRGSISSILIPQSGQEKLWLKLSMLPSAASPPFTSTSARPLARCRTFSIESVSRCSIPGFTIRRSTTISILCLIFFSQLDIFRKAHTCFRQSAPGRSRYASPAQAALRAHPCVPHDGRKQLNPAALRKRHDLIHHLINALLCDDLSALRTVRRPDPCIEQTENSHKSPSLCRP